MTLSRSFVDSYADRTPPWGPVGYVTYKRTYARCMPNGLLEEWYQTLERGVNGLTYINTPLTRDEAERLYDYMFNLKCTVSGRGLWQLGTKVIDRLGGDSLQNCWAVTMNSLEAFSFVFNELMLGGGVGCNIQPAYVYELPTVSYSVDLKRVSSFDCNYIVPDNREGWINLLDRVMRSALHTGEPVIFNTTCVRGKGAKIKTFGGVASGPEDLTNGIFKINEILKTRLNKKLRPVDVLDICDIIGEVVVSGNVRRSALIAMGEIDDQQFVNAKNWHVQQIPSHRSMSNNSVICNNIKILPEEFWDCYSKDHETVGFVNLDLLRCAGRIIDGYTCVDHRIIGVNPCGEIGLEAYEPCNLAEIFLPMVKDEAELADIAALLVRVTKTITTLPYLHPKTTEVIERNRRIGVGISGIFQAPQFAKASVLNRLYRHIVSADATVSAEMGIPRAIKHTTVKPSGTVALLPGVFPGAHYAKSPYMIRRIRYASNSPFLVALREAGYHIEPEKCLDGSSNLNTMVVDFPISYSPKLRFEDTATAVEQLDNLLFLQRHWADNSVSITVTYEPSELPDIRSWLGENYTDNIKSVSFLQRSHGFEQAPFESITKGQYEAMLSGTKPVNHIKIEGEVDDVDESECKTGACPIK